MIISMDESRASAVFEWLAACPDAEPEGEGYVVDLYEADPPVSLELVPAKEGADVLAALYLHYDEEMDGWYLGEQIDDAALIARVLQSIG